jgi:hypothetical protein
MTAKPVSQEDLIELRRAMANWSFIKSDKPLVAVEDEDGVVHLCDQDTGAPRMHMPREVFDELRTWKPPIMWRSEDPRHVINKYGAIVIVRPRAPGIERRESSVAFVDTKHGYYIHTEFEEPYNSISVDDDWPEGWQWAWAPKES